MIDRKQLLQTLQLPQKLPTNFSGSYEKVTLKTFDGKILGSYDIEIVPSHGHMKHRIFIRCICFRLIPFGRYFQHKCNLRILNDYVHGILPRKDKSNAEG